jgi:fucose 4-O-acetylase-like acetyltransferase
MGVGASESAQIGICRVLCIFFMMSVHVSPGLGQASLVSTGSLAWLGALWGGFLGRASVAALSFVGGYLLVRTAAGAPLASLARRRFRTLIVPMLSWSLIFCLLRAGRAMVLGRPEEILLLQPESDPLALLTGLTGPTANLSLFFLRDLFVSSILVWLLRPFLAARPGPVLGLLAVATVLDLTAPIVFRPSILLFVAAGAAHATRSETLSGELTWPRAAAVALGLAAGLLILSGLGSAPGPIRELEDLLRRGLLVVLALAASAALADTRAARLILPLERRIFETYLLHVPLIGMLWLPWTMLVGGPEADSYLLFFLLAPVAALAAGLGLGAACDRAPAALQTLLRGKVRRPAAIAAAG